MPKPVPPIDDDIYAYVQDHAVPLEDDFNSALRRLLGLTSEDGASSNTGSGASSSGRRRTSKAARTRAAKGSLLEEAAYELPILEALAEQGGRAATSEVINRVGEKLAGKLTQLDRATLRSGDIRWRIRAQFVRLALVKRGDLVSGSPRGVWEISDQGRERIGEHS